MASLSGFAGLEDTDNTGETRLLITVVPVPTLFPDLRLLQFQARRVVLAGPSRFAELRNADKTRTPRLQSQAPGSRLRLSAWLKSELADWGKVLKDSGAEKHVEVQGVLFDIPDEPRGLPCSKRVAK